MPNSPRSGPRSPVAPQSRKTPFIAGPAAPVPRLRGSCIQIARDLIHRGELSGPRAAEVLALTSVALADAFVCCWDTKFAYWMPRPITADPTLDVLIPIHPSLRTPLAATISAAAGAVLDALYPADAATAWQAQEAKNSRPWAGIHYPIDNDGGAVGR